MNILHTIIHKWFGARSQTKQNKQPVWQALQTKQETWSSPTIGRKTPKEWYNARILASDTEPRNDYLMDVYADAMLDTHLHAVCEKRKLALINRAFILRKENGEVDEQRSRWFESSWFKSVLGWVLESRFYGYSLIAITGADAARGELQVQLADRRRTLPQRQLLLRQPDEKTGALRYVDYPNQLLFASLGRAFGLLDHHKW